MPTTETFTYRYSLFGNPSSGFSIRGLMESRNHILLDNRDGAADGSTEVGDLVGYRADGAVISQTWWLEGFSSTGQPVLSTGDHTGILYYLLSNDVLTQGFNINFTTEGTYNYCFAPGTGIATPSGEVVVERLAIGDRVLTADGRMVPVRWIGRQTLSRLFAGDRARPVRIAAGALGDGLPHADLTVTADHGMILDGLVINAGALVNGTTITLVTLAELPDRVTYYHVETEDHDVILAHGAAAETFVDYAGRAAFDNYADYVALYGQERRLPEITRPRITSARQLPRAIRARLGCADVTPLRRAKA